MVVALAFRNRTADSALCVKQQKEQRKIDTALPPDKIGMASGKVGSLEKEGAKASVLF